MRHHLSLPENDADDKNPYTNTTFGNAAVIRDGEGRGEIEWIPYRMLVCKQIKLRIYIQWSSTPTQSLRQYLLQDGKHLKPQTNERSLSFYFGMERLNGRCVQTMKILFDNVCLQCKC